VGLGAFAAYLSVLAKGIELRARRHPGRSLDIIIAENIHDGAHYFRKALEALLPPDFPLAENVGLVETSIGKMVPIMRKEDLAADPLLLFAEEYNEFHCRQTWVQELPSADSDPEPCREHTGLCRPQTLHS